MSPIAKTYYDTPLGPVEIIAGEMGLRSLAFVETTGEEAHPDHEFLVECMEQLQEYFDGNRNHFTMLLDMQGTDFQLRVWRELLEIPMGRTSTYLEIARKVSSAAATRAVGAACGANPLGILVPCHRVLATNGSLTGYAGGIKRKRKLLHHERAVLHGEQLELF